MHGTYYTQAKEAQRHGDSQQGTAPRRSERLETQN